MKIYGMYFKGVIQFSPKKGIRGKPRYPTKAPFRNQVPQHIRGKNAFEIRKL